MAESGEAFTEGTSTEQIEVKTRSGSYTVYIEPGARQRLPGVVERAAPSGRCVLISDETVLGLWGDDVLGILRRGGLEVAALSFPAGEVHKTRKTWARLTDEILDLGLGRDGCVVALGGGVVGDVAGFVAATYMRGVPVVQVPTTTLAMIDASVGGKTGVDHRSGKNLVGAFHPPAAVVGDTEFLSTLSTDLRGQGFAEALKHGFILDLSHAEDLARSSEALLDGDPSVTAPVIRRSASLKARVVEADERESGFREVLNFGHTVAHAVELAEEFRLPHGHAVAIGMVAEARLGEKLGFTREGTAALVEEKVTALGLPVSYEGCSGEELTRLASHDKKNRQGQIRVVFLSEAGKVDANGGWAKVVDRTDFEAQIETCLRGGG